jgi:hypothetical protein
MSSLHSTLTALIDALVRDILRVVRESAVHELVGVDVRPAPSRSPRGAKEREKGPPSAPRPRASRTNRAAKRRVPNGKPRDVGLAPARPKERRRPRGPTPTAASPLAPSPDVTLTAGEDTPKDAVQITDPDALLRETAVTVPVPRPWASEMPVVGQRVEVPTQPTLREGEALLRTPSGSAVLRRRRDA